MIEPDPQHCEAEEHLLRIKARVAEEAIERQRAINEKIVGNEKLADIGLKVLDATLTAQTDHNPYSEVVLRAIVRGVDAACEALGLILERASFLESFQFAAWEHLAATSMERESQ
jgi:hypothetical protein